MARKVESPIVWDINVRNERLNLIKKKVRRSKDCNIFWAPPTHQVKKNIYFQGSKYDLKKIALKNMAIKNEKKINFVIFFFGHRPAQFAIFVKETKFWLLYINIVTIEADQCKLLQIRSHKIAAIFNILVVLHSKVVCLCLY